MPAMAFDNLEFAKRLLAKRLKEAGFTEQQAEALAAAEAELIENNLATKRDLQELEVALKKDIKELELRLEAKINELNFDLVKWIAGLLLAQAGLIAALVKLL